MTRQDKIYKLKELISIHEHESYELTRMRERWNDHDDPGSDPGLQYEQELIVEKSYYKIIEYIKTM